MVTRGWFAIWIGVLVGCGPSIVVQGDDTAAALSEGSGSSDGGEAGGDVGTSSDPSDSSTPPNPTVGGATDAADTGTEDGSVDGGNVFLPDPTGGSCGELPPGTLGHCRECDLFTQNCPEDEKCMPWANDGGSSWNATRCSPIADNPADVGQACDVEGNGVTGIDNCVLGAMCFYVDPDTLQGTCLSLCEGSPEDPTCPPDASCSIGADSVLSLCIPTCDPLGDACSDEQTCVPGSNGSFQCTPLAPDPSADGEACGFLNDCQPGLTCLAAEVSGCDDALCCTSYCDLTLGEPNPACLDPEHECLPWFERGEFPPGLGDLGVCGLPQQ